MIGLDGMAACCVENNGYNTATARKMPLSDWLRIESDWQQNLGSLEESGGTNHAVLHSYRLVLDLCAGTGGAGDKGAACFSQEDQLGEQCAPQHRQEDPSPISQQDSPNLHKEHTCLPW